jgi:ParB family chromosome partitioning protein
MSLKNREIDMGHARALLALDSPSMQLKLFRDVLKNQYSVRKVEEMVQMLKSGEDVGTVRKKIAVKAQLPKHYDEMRQRLGEQLKAKVLMTCGTGGKGKITIPFANEDELRRIMESLVPGK